MQILNSPTALFATPYGWRPLNASRSHRQRPLLDEPLHRAGGEHGAPGRRRPAHGADPQRERRRGMDLGGASAPAPDAAFRRSIREFTAATVSDFLLRDTDNPSSVMSSIETARNNARMVRTALTRETWESINEAWMSLKRMLGRADRRARPAEGARRDQARDGADPRLVLRHHAAQRDLRFLAARHLRRARRQHRAHPRREILRAAAVDLLGRLVARQLPVGIDPALGRRRTAPIAGSTRPTTSRPTSPTI